VKLSTFIWGIILIILIGCGCSWALNDPTHTDDPIRKSFTQSNVVYVESHLASNWAASLRSSRRFVDQYTGTSLSLHSCDASHRCIKVYNANVPGKFTGREYRVGSYSRIDVEKSIPGKYRIAVLDHEMGHAFGLRDNPHCVSRMYQYVTCFGHTNPRTYTTAERRILKGN
jgi:hypothetical protein